jgi:hypothetical protein
MASGVFTIGKNGKLIFHRIAGPQDEEVVQIAKRVAKRVSQLVENYLNNGPNAENQSAHDQAIAESVQVNFPFIDTEEGEGEASYLRGRQCASVDGYSIHAQTSVGSKSREELERLCRYGLRPAFAMNRLELLPDGRIRYRLRKRWKDGSTHLVMDPLVFMRRLASFIPAPYKNLTRYHGVFAANANFRPMLKSMLPKEVLVNPSPKPQEPSPNQEPSPKVLPIPSDSSSTCPKEVPKPQEGLPKAPAGSSSSDALCPETAPIPKTIRPRRLPWAELLKRTFRIDLTQCAKCQGLLIIIAFITDPVIVSKILTHLHLPTEIPSTEPSRTENQLAFEFDEQIDADGSEIAKLYPLQRLQRGPPAIEWVMDMGG